MAELENDKHPAGPLFHQPPPGYWRTKFKLERMVRFKNLIIHRERWAGDIDMASPIAELFPGESLASNSSVTVQRINQEIKQMMWMVNWDLNYIGVATRVNYKERDPVDGEVINKYDLILDYYRLPRNGNPHIAYQAVIDVLEQGIGLYKGRLKQAKQELFNPINWAAYVIRIPITVMERAGFGASEKSQDMLIGWYARFMQILMGLIFSFIAIREGIKVQWKEIVTDMWKWLFK